MNIRRGYDLLAAEWIKLWSLRSTYLALAAAVVATPAISIGVAQANVSYIRSGRPHGPDQIDAMATSFRGIAIAQLIIGVLGALTITSEFGSGLIRTTFAATPQRGAVLTAKATVLGIVTLIFGQALAFSTFLGTQTILGRIHAGLGIGAPGVLRSVSSAGLYLTVVALLGLSIGALVRHTPAAIATVVVFFFLIPQIPGVLPIPWSYRFADALPSTATQQLTTLTPTTHLLTLTQSYLLLLGYAILMPLAGALVLHRRDA